MTCESHFLFLNLLYRHISSFTRLNTSSFEILSVYCIFYNTIVQKHLLFKPPGLLWETVGTVIRTKLITAVTAGTGTAAREVIPQEWDGWTVVFHLQTALVS